MFLISVKPIWVSAPNCGCRTRIWTKAQKDKRWRTPFCPVMTLVRTPDKPSEPGHCGTRNSGSVIAGSGDNCNRHQSGNISPPPPAMKLQQIVGSHDPDKACFRVAIYQFFEGFCGIYRAEFGFDSGSLYVAAARLRLCGRQPRGQGSHALFGFQGVARRHQPITFIKAKRIHREQADRPMSIMRGVERTAHQANSFQGRVCP